MTFACIEVAKHLDSGTLSCHEPRVPPAVALMAPYDGIVNDNGSKGDDPVQHRASSESVESNSELPSLHLSNDTRK